MQLAATTPTPPPAYEVPTPRPSTWRQRQFLAKAARAAQKSSMTHRHGCIIVAADGTIVSEGFNHHRMAMSHRFSIHAEVAALHRAKRAKTRFTDCEMYVVRLGPGPSALKYSRPCEDCVHEITKSGIRRVYYSTNENCP